MHGFGAVSNAPPSLPHCLHRGTQVGDAHWFCATDRLPHGGIVAEEYCRKHCDVFNLPVLHPQGLGDTVHQVTHALGVDRLVHAAIGECDCAERKAWLNRLLPYAPPADVPACPEPPPGRLPFSGPVVRNLMMHIYPVRENQFWRWNVDQMLQRLHLFNGVRAIAIALGPETDDAETVQRAFDGHCINKWIIEPNEVALREVQTWPRLMASVFSCDPNAITFSCHAKGVRGGRSYDDPGIARRDPTSLWAQCMYETCLDGHRIAEQLLETHTFAGSLKCRGVWGGPGRYRASWHYAGTFYWFRNARLFSQPDWSDIEPAWYATETYPGTRVGWGQAGCIFGEHAGSPYDAETWERLLPLWEQWRTQHLS